MGLLAFEQSKGSEFQMAKPAWLGNQWFIGIATAIVGAIILWLLPILGGYLLIAMGQAWHGTLDRAYANAPFANVWLSQLNLAMSSIFFVLVLTWLLLLIAPARRTRAAVIGMTCLTFLASIIIEPLGQLSVNAYTTYERRIMLLTPAFSEEERKALVSVWARVQSKADYDKLMAMIEALGKKYDITLPPRPPSLSGRWNLAGGQ
jgi:hypothetical protein